MDRCHRSPMLCEGTLASGRHLCLHLRFVLVRYRHREHWSLRILYAVVLNLLHSSSSILSPNSVSIRNAIRRTSFELISFMMMQRLPVPLIQVRWRTKSRTASIHSLRQQDTEERAAYGGAFYHAGRREMLRSCRIVPSTDPAVTR